MDYPTYVDAMQRIATLVDQRSYDEALTEIRTLLASDLLDRDKGVLCINMAVIYDKLEQPTDALEWYDRGIGYERTYRSHMVAEHKAAFLVAHGKHAEGLRLYDELKRDRSLGESDKHRLTQTVTALRKQLGEE